MARDRPLGERIDVIQAVGACVLIGAAAFAVGRDALLLKEKGRAARLAE